MKKSESIAIELGYMRLGFYFATPALLACLVGAYFVHGVVLAIAVAVLCGSSYLFLDSIKLLKKQLLWWQRLESGDKTMPLIIVQRYSDLVSQQKILNFEEEAAWNRRRRIAQLKQEIEAPLKE